MNQSFSLWPLRQKLQERGINSRKVYVPDYKLTNNDKYGVTAQCYIPEFDCYIEVITASYPEEFWKHNYESRSWYNTWTDTVRKWHEDNNHNVIWLTFRDKVSYNRSFGPHFDELVFDITGDKDYGKTVH